MEERKCSICGKWLGYRETITLFIGKRIYMCPKCYRYANNMADERVIKATEKRKKK